MIETMLVLVGACFCWMEVDCVLRLMTFALNMVNYVCCRLAVSALTELHAYRTAASQSSVGGVRLGNTPPATG